MDKIKYGIIGAGTMAREHILNLSLINEAELVALSDPHDESIKQCQELIKKEVACFNNHLDLIDLEKRYGETLAVRGINLSLPENTYCCLLGPSGCGKTSLLRMIAGHEDITNGTVFLDNRNISNEPPAARSTSMMFQSYALFQHLKVIDNVAFALKIMGVGKNERHARAMELLESVQLHTMSQRYPSQLSGGQQQRVALARALITLSLIHI